MSLVTLSSIKLKYTCSFTSKVVLLCIVGLVLIVVGLVMGGGTLSFSEIWQSLWHSDNEVVKFIVWETRFPALLTAIFAGMALGVVGLVMQTVFVNPLADPGILGVNAGAALGVAVAILACGGSVVLKGMVISGFLLSVVSALVGASLVMGILTLCSSFLNNYLTLLVVGVMVSYLASSFISLFNFYSTTQGISTFVFWGFGDFSSLTIERVGLLGIAVGLGLVALLLQIKSLNALLLGDDYARNVGVSIRYRRTILLFWAGWLCAVVTATCGPISFLGLAVPHVVRILFQTANHRQLLPLCMLVGGVLALFCHCVTQSSPIGILPLNAITSLIGAPLVLYLLIRRKF